MSRGRIKSIMHFPSYAAFIPWTISHGYIIRWRIQVAASPSGRFNRSKVSDLGTVQSFRRLAMRNLMYSAGLVWTCSGKMWVAEPSAETRHVKVGIYVEDFHLVGRRDLRHQWCTKWFGDVIWSWRHGRKSRGRRWDFLWKTRWWGGERSKSRNQNGKLRVRD